MIPSVKPVAGDARPAVWIVDGSPVCAAQAHAALCADFQTRCFVDGSTMLAALTPSRFPDLVLIDANLPDMAGIELCRVIKRAEATHALPVVVVNAHPDVQVVVDDFAAGANDCVSRPLNALELTARVRALISTRAEHALETDLEQQQAAVAQYRTELRYRALIEGLPGLVFVIAKGRVVFMTPQALKTFCGNTPVVGGPMGDLFHADDRENAIVQLSSVVSKTTPLHLELRMIQRDGAEMTAELNAQSVVFDGEPAIVVLARDVGAAKRNQELLISAEKMASVGMLAAGVAHELNNPLASLLSNLDFVCGEMGANALAPGNLVDVREALTQAMDAGRRVREIVRDLRVLSRPEEAGHSSAIDVHPIIESTLRMAGNELRSRAKVVTCFGAVPAVLASEGRLGQVLLNLVVNAAQAIAEGAVASNEVRITTRVSGNQVAIDVSDIGSGMGPEVLAKLFQPYFTTKSAEVGTGLGLWISHEIVRRLGGQILVSSEVGHGTTFTLLLPIAPGGRDN